FVAIGFAYHAFYATPALWVATAGVALALLAAPAVQGPRMSTGAAALVAAIALVIPIVALVPFRAPTEAPEQTSFRLMTYNVHQGFDAGQVPSLDALTETIAREAPDVLVLQEVARGWVIDEQHDVLNVLAERLGMQYVWQGNIGDLFGNAILTRMPMTDVRRVSYTKEAAVRHQQRGALMARISGVLVIVTHLDQHADAADVRQRQVRELLRAWDGATPAVIAGDLNAAPASLEMDLLLQSGFSDLALQAGADEGTYPSERPERRIDYVWGVGVSGSQAHTVASKASDHRAVVVNVTRVTGR
ncbi:MAG: endonuclease/exonuclease/phosphatase family protein, partial [Actinobacteria bacterium]|nr:endonuclease/exonuclease/phosphatase family protein [Actinomycetota bacterium]